MKARSGVIRNAATASLVLCLISAKISAQELILNSGFSANTANWNTSCSIEIYPETVYGGSVSGNNITEIDVERCLNQQVCIFPGSSYHFGFKATRRIDNATPASVGITVKVTGVQTGTDYVNTNIVYTNTTWNLAAQGFSFSLPDNSADKKVNIQFSNYNNTGTYGVLVDDISLAPTDSLKLMGPDAATVNIGANFSVANIPASGVNYNWTFSGGANPASSTASAPSNVQWTANGNKAVTVGLDNGMCTVTTLTKNVVVSSVLPVKLISFSGSYSKSKVELKWVADDENNEGKYFIIERAKQSTFDSIGRVAVSSAIGSVTYNFSDADALAGANQYRLKQVDRNGSFSYSKIITITATASQAMQVYPNPAVSMLSFRVGSEGSQAVFLQVYSITGRMAISKKQHLAAGLNEGALDISSLQPGSYFLRIASSDEANMVQAFTKK
ncbi:MAG: T9SS type A sorting domain-containing protein [Flavitalea sp.]